MLVVDEEQMKSRGVRAVIITKRVAVGGTAGEFGQAVRIRGRREWQKHKMGRRQLVGITGQRIQAGGGKEVLVEGKGSLQLHSSKNCITSPSVKMSFMDLQSLSQSPK